MKAARIALALAATALSGCSGATGLTTGSIFGSDKPPPKETINDPSMRAFQVGTMSARAIKCGFNFDPAKLKTNYLAYEKQTAGVDMSKIERVYDVSFNGVAKAVAAETDYCSPEKTRAIKVALGRHLVGDYSPSPMPKVAQEEGLLSGWGSGGSDSEGMKVKHPLDNSD